ncbi:MAG TPA: PIN domain-containing protein [Candidatus Kapabacteria bacterium]|nr:PIN domain-containing protein [Candidatus Kapabacteria bacterium]
MAYKVFVDTNIILDIFLKRDPFFNNSQKTVLECVENDLIPHISGSSVTDLFYICKKSGMKEEIILDNLKELLEAFEVVIIDKSSILNAISSEIKDFEDAVQIMACQKEKINLIITRNKKDFKTDKIQVQTPEEFLASILKGKFA